MFSKDELHIILKVFDETLLQRSLSDSESWVYDKVESLMRIESAEHPKPPYKPNLPGFSRV